MHEQSHYAVGIDIGTTMIRCVVGHIDSDTGKPTVVGVGEAPNSGMRKGVVANLAGPAKVIDEVLGEAERMSGYEVNEATISINGSHILSSRADGMIAAGGADHEITEEDLFRVEEVATVGKIPANREIIEVVPHSYRLDGQDNIKDPIGMTGTRLEIDAAVVSALIPHVNNIKKAAEMATVQTHSIVPSVLAGAKAVLNEKQTESGVAVIDMGGATTSVAVFEEGDLQFVGVVPIGGNNITNDLAIGLKTNPEVAEQVKLKHASAVIREESETVSVKYDKESLQFERSDIDEIVEARLEEIFEGVEKELKKAGRAGKLPSGVVLIGDGSHLNKVVDYAKETLGLAVTIGRPTGFAGVNEKVEQPEFASAVGLMLLDADTLTTGQAGHKVATGAVLGGKLKASKGFLSNIFKKFK